MSRVIYSKKSGKSGRALEVALDQAGYDGPLINFGFSESWARDEEVFNHPDAIARAVNKGEALRLMTEAGVSTLWFDHNVSVPAFPIMTRPEQHRAGKWRHVCKDFDSLAHSFRLHNGRGGVSKARATHCQRFLENPREFRVHVFNGKSIKMSEKIGGGNHTLGGIFGYPHEFPFKSMLRDQSKAAVEALGLDFAAVDLLWQDGQAFVLEANTAPRLTDPRSNTLEKYVSAFMGTIYE